MVEVNQVSRCKQLGQLRDIRLALIVTNTLHPTEEGTSSENTSIDEDVSTIENVHQQGTQLREINLRSTMNNEQETVIITGDDMIENIFTDPEEMALFSDLERLYIRNMIRRQLEEITNTRLYIMSFPHSPQLFELYTRGEQHAMILSEMIHSTAHEYTDEISSQDSIMIPVSFYVLQQLPVDIPRVRISQTQINNNFPYCLVFVNDRNITRVLVGRLANNTHGLRKSDLILLLLSGDVETNPGPKLCFTCGRENCGLECPSNRLCRICFSRKHMSKNCDIPENKRSAFKKDYRSWQAVMSVGSEAIPMYSRQLRGLLKFQGIGHIENFGAWSSKRGVFEKLRNDVLDTVARERVRSKKISKSDLISDSIHQTELSELGLQDAFDDISRASREEADDIVSPSKQDGLLSLLSHGNDPPGDDGGGGGPPENKPPMFYYWGDNREEKKREVTINPNDGPEGPGGGGGPPDGGGEGSGGGDSPPSYSDNAKDYRDGLSPSNPCQLTDFQYRVGYFIHYRFIKYYLICFIAMFWLLSLMSGTGMLNRSWFGLLDIIAWSTLYVMSVRTIMILEEKKCKELSTTSKVMLPIWNAFTYNQRYSVEVRFQFGDVVALPEHARPCPTNCYKGVMAPVYRKVLIVRTDMRGNICSERNSKSRISGIINAAQLLDMWSEPRLSQNKNLEEMEIIWKEAFVKYNENPSDLYTDFNVDINIKSMTMEVLKGKWLQTQIALNDGPNTNPFERRQKESALMLSVTG